MSIFSIIKSEIRELDWKHSWWPVLFGIVAISPTIGAIPSTTPLYYAMLILTGLLFLTKSLGTCSLMVVFLVACYASVLFGHPAEFFQSHIRVVVYTIVLLVASPLIQSDYVRNFRQKSLYVILKACVLVAIISFVFYFLGINYMRALSEDITYIGNAGLFGGLTRQSMLLGPMSGIATVYCGYKALRTKQKWYWLAAVPCIACTMFAASRSAFLAAIAGILAMFYTFAKSKSQFMRIIFSVMVIGAVTLPLWDSAMDGLQEKNQRNVETGSALSSRNEKWDNRIEEFKSSPLTGVGFFSCDTRNVEDYSLAGGIEPGSSWLAILSMTGLFGFIPFCLLMRNSIRNVWRRRTEESALLMGLIAFISLHMLAEGYIIACGSPFCFMAWLIIACSYDRQYSTEL